jgi:DNA-binding NtrC family response regulator
MPVIGGLELANRVKSMAPRIKVICMSVYAAVTLSGHGLPQPDAESIQKPFTPTALAEKLRQVLSNRGRSLESRVSAGSAAVPPAGGPTN